MLKMKRNADAATAKSHAYRTMQCGRAPVQHDNSDAALKFGSPETHFFDSESFVLFALQKVVGRRLALVHQNPSKASYSHHPTSNTICFWSSACRS